MQLAQDLRPGNIIKQGRDLYVILKAEYFRAARTNAVVKTKYKNMSTGSVSEVIFKLNEKLDDVRLDKREMQFLYDLDGMYAFMDQETYDQMEIPKEDIGDNVNYIKEQDMVSIVLYEGKALSVEVPKAVELKVTYSETGLRGDTSGKVTKPATVETGYELAVPVFVNVDDVIRIDTATGEYIERVK
ncbi:MAG: elongation factor P [Candidatus Margulisiibacteriota bacterium]|nr:MAG: elongation factor P [Candidatus Margulisbacteria bacterium GWD2_39_127]OGI05101.1 MAG: elongation factor P [Candidatus Margulisbacteria bacterium GWF2_38_17]OGI09197.1 MAG: elongation factor P [Candidatus Margulisbacteria bacterium GWE2_39_32]PZM83730.1 MAG: elongation factor P [Candidatus Margulisiibacteriota bacterium]HAR63079.1 elongation factor P [Candidatus Margulisiibacteriota bacterium]